jgi:putative alpha-1,2-mannosidase
MIKLKLLLASLGIIGITTVAKAADGPKPGKATEKQPVDYVNPNIGNISHMLVPTYPTTHLPNSMMRVFPVRNDYTTNFLGGLPLIVTQHRAASGFIFYPYQGDVSGIAPQLNLSYDQEKVTPYRYQVYLDDLNIGVDFAPSHQSAVYSLTFEKQGIPFLIFNCEKGHIEAKGNVISGYKELGNKTNVYLYAITDATPVKTGVPVNNGVNWGAAPQAALALQYPGTVRKLGIRYGISFISIAQATVMT